METIDITIEDYREQYVAKVGHGDDIVIAGNESDGYYFTTADGVFETAPGVEVPDYILQQPWSYKADEIDNPAAKYYKIGERLYEWIG